MYIYVNDRINIVNSELNSPRIREGDYFFRFDKIESVNLALLIILIMYGTLIVMATSTITMIMVMIMKRVLVRIILILCCKMLEIDYSVKGRKFLLFLLSFLIVNYIINRHGKRGIKWINLIVLRERVYLVL